MRVGVVAHQLARATPGRQGRVARGRVAAVDAVGEDDGLHLRIPEGFQDRGIPVIGGEQGRLHPVGPVVEGEGEGLGREAEAGESRQRKGPQGGAGIHHASSRSTAARMAAGPGRKASSSGGLAGVGVSAAPRRSTGASSQGKQVSPNAGGQLGPGAVGATGLREHEHAVGALHQIGDGRIVQGPEGAQVQHRHVEVGHGLQGRVLRGAVGEDAGIRTVPAQGGLAQPGRGRFVPLVLQAAVEAFVLQEQHGVGVVDGSPQQGVGVGHGAGRHHLQTGAAEEMPLGVLAVEGTAALTAARRTAEHHGHARRPSASESWRRSSP